MKDKTSDSLLGLLNYGHEKWLSYPYDSVRTFLAKHNPILINVIYFNQLEEHNKHLVIHFCMEVLSNGEITGENRLRILH